MYAISVYNYVTQIVRLVLYYPTIKVPGFLSSMLRLCVRACVRVCLKFSYIAWPYILFVHNID